jgi:hypothetical protein
LIFPNIRRGGGQMASFPSLFHADAHEFERCVVTWMKRLGMTA